MFLSPRRGGEDCSGWSSDELAASDVVDRERDGDKAHRRARRYEGELSRVSELVFDAFIGWLEWVVMGSRMVGIDHERLGAE